MKKFFKVVIWIIILGAACFGIYKVLPEYPHNFVKSFVQPVVDSTAKMRIEQVQNLPVTDIEGVEGQTYKTVLEKNTGMSCWVYETREAEPGIEYVIYRGNGASMNLKDFADYKGMLATSAAVKYEFKISGNNVEIYPYIDGTLMHIEDGKHVDANKAIKKSILTQLYSGMKTE